MTELRAPDRKEDRASSGTSNRMRRATSTRDRWPNDEGAQISRPRTFDLVDAPVPRLDPNETDQIVVRTAFVSICGSDIPFFNGTNARVAYPLPPGAHVHECVGEVVEILLARLPAWGFRHGHPRSRRRPGGALPRPRDCARALLPQALHGQGEACIIQPLATVLNAVDQLGDVQGKSIAVLGLGSIGLMFCWLLGLRRAGEVVGIDPLPQRCAVAERMGATRTFHRRCRRRSPDPGANPASRAWSPRSASKPSAIRPRRSTTALN